MTIIRTRMKIDATSCSGKIATRSSKINSVITPSVAPLVNCVSTSSSTFLAIDDGIRSRKLNIIMTFITVSCEYGVLRKV